MNWKNININESNIESQSSFSVLIKMPNKSKYAGFKFWHPAKLVRKGRHSAAVSIGYNDDFVFKLFKSGNGRYNKFDKIDEKTILAHEFEEAFSKIDENIIEDNDYDTADGGYVRIDEPEFRKPVENSVAEDLKL